MDGLIKEVYNRSIERLQETMCDEYCKWPLIWDEEKEGCPLSESEVCKNCPSLILEVMARDD